MMRGLLALALSVVLVQAASPAVAQVDHAQRIAMEVAMKRAQVRARCDFKIVRKLPTYPPTGTGGPVVCPPRR